MLLLEQSKERLVAVLVAFNVGDQYANLFVLPCLQCAGQVAGLQHAVDAACAGR